MFCYPRWRRNCKTGKHTEVYMLGQFFQSGNILQTETCFCRIDPLTWSPHWRVLCIACIRNFVTILIIDKHYLLFCFCILCVYTNFKRTQEVHDDLALPGTIKNVTVSNNYLKWTYKLIFGCKCHTVRLLSL